MARKAAKVVPGPGPKKVKNEKADDAVFLVDFTAHPMKTYESDEKFLEDKVNYDEPFVLINSQVIKDALQGETCDFARSMRNFDTRTTK